MHIYAQDWRINLLRQTNYPFVMIGHCADNTGLNFVDLDFESAVKAAFNHLVQSGHRKIGYLALPGEMREKGYGPAMRSWEGYEKALNELGLDLACREVNFHSQDILDATLSLLEERPDLTAIVTSHELGFRSIVQALKSLGRSVPDDFSLVAIMTEQMGELATPRMTHIDFPTRYMGYHAVEMLIRSLEGELVEPEQILIPPRLIVRDSVAPLRE
jgi:DNA-binding LacI/PurR family transcriptional regulator